MQQALPLLLTLARLALGGGYIALPLALLLPLHLLLDLTLALLLALQRGHPPMLLALGGGCASPLHFMRLPLLLVY